MGPLRTNDNPNSGGGGGFGPSQLAGPPSGPGGPGEQPDPSATPGGVGTSPDSEANSLQAVVEQVRVMEQGLQALAQQFPAAAPDIRRATDAVRAVLQRIVSSPAEPEPPAPNSMA